jgi:N-acetylneuraminic acid mutarotase
MNKLIQAATAAMLLSIILSAFLFPIGGAAENEWTAKKPMLTAREGLGVAVVNGKIYAIGGLNNDTNLAVNEEYDPATDIWKTKEPMPTARSGFAIAAYQSKIYVIGGTTGTSDASGFTDKNEVYDPATDTWETMVSMPTPRADLCASVVNGSIYLIGGKEYWEGSLNHELNVTEVYDPTTDTWTTAASMPIPVFGYASAVVDGKIYVMGGTRQFLESWTNLETVGSNQVYDVQNDTWSIGTDLSSVRSYAAAAATSGLTAPKRIYIVGGFNEVGYSTSAVNVYDVENKAWSPGASMITARRNLALAVVNDVLYAIGGFDGDNWLRANEAYTPFGYGTVPPALQVLAPENRTYASNNVSMVLSVNKPTSWIGYSLDDHANVTVSGDTVLTGLAEGQHRLLVYANDTFGNTASSNLVQFNVDTLPPTVSVFSPENKTYDGSDIRSVIVVDEPFSWLGYSLDGQDNVTITGNVTLAVLREGSHNITFYAEDTVGNAGTSGTVYFNVAFFPTVWVAGVAVTLTIAAAAAYLVLKRRKKIAIKKTA